MRAASRLEAIVPGALRGLDRHRGMTASLDAAAGRRIGENK
jgi:hypothetical protein